MGDFDRDDGGRRGTWGTWEVAGEVAESFEHARRVAASGLFVRGRLSDQFAPSGAVAANA